MPQSKILLDTNAYLRLAHNLHPLLFQEFGKKKYNRSQVQGSTFRVKGKKSIEDPKYSLNMVISQSNCKFGYKFWIRHVENDVFLINSRSKCSPGTKMKP